MEITKISDTVVNISIPWGNTGSFSVSATIDDVATSLVTGDTVYFTIKNSTSATPKILQKTITSFTDGVASVSLTSADTKSLKPGIYKYDIKVIFANGDAISIIEPSDFEITGVVTYE